MSVHTTVLALLACVGTAAALDPPPGSSYQVVPVEDGGAISGSVRLLGAAPEAEILDTPTSDAACHVQPIPDESLVVSKEKGVKWAVVSIRSIAAGKPFAEEAVVLDQSGCRFFPHVAVTPVGSELHVLNSDDVLHNVHTRSLKNAPVNRSMRADMEQLAIKFKRKETLSITCDVHNWMKAWIIVAPHPYFAVTDEQGGFRLDDVPPGTYQLRVWHERLGKQDAEVVVRAHETSEVVFELQSKS